MWHGQNRLTEIAQGKSLTFLVRLLSRKITFSMKTCSKSREGLYSF